MLPPGFLQRLMPTTLQAKIIWLAVTAFAWISIGWMIIVVGKLIVESIAFLQPLLIPVAIAGILAYLLDPVVEWFERRKLPRTVSVLVVFLIILAFGAGVLLWVLPVAWKQGEAFAHNVPQYSQKAQTAATQVGEWLRSLQEMPIFQKETAAEGNGDKITEYVTKMVDDGILWLGQKTPDIISSTGNFLRNSLGGVFGVFGFLLSLILVPVFLFFFLREGQSIARNWSNYLPLRASPLKSEIVSLLTEINRYLINFFRGQLIVSMIDGMLIGVSLLILGLDFSLLIGLMVGILGLIPYVGMMICWVPAVIIAIVQFGGIWPPVIVTIIFIVANQIDGLVIAPKIVGESVGLHPLTVIISVLAWSLVLGGLLGALLAVPLTATLKVVLKRYFWDKPPSAPASA